MNRRRSPLAAILVACTALSLSRNADAEPRAPCDASYEAGQEARRSGHLLEARAHFVTCARPECPAFEISDCTTWLSAVTATLPSIIVRTRTPDGHDVRADVLVVDGVRRDDGPSTESEIELNPGPHVLQARGASGWTSETTRVTVVEGQKRREIILVGDPPRGPPPRPLPRAATTSTGILVLGALGLTVLTAGVVVDAKGYFGDTLPLRDCAGNCSHDRVQTARAELLVGDVLLGAGAVLLGVTAWLYLNERTSRGDRP